jgi:hypothetical protein
MSNVTCPFCNSKRVSVISGWVPCYMECERCNARGPDAATEDDAILWWEIAGRVDPTHVRRALRRLRTAIKAEEKARANSSEAQREREAAKQAREDKKWADARRKWLMSPTEPEHADG